MCLVSRFSVDKKAQNHKKAQNLRNSVSPPHMDVWADQVARGIGGGAGIWNVSTWGRDGGMGWAQ